MGAAGEHPHVLRALAARLDHVRRVPTGRCRLGQEYTHDTSKVIGHTSLHPYEYAQCRNGSDMSDVRRLKLRFSHTVLHQLPVITLAILQCCAKPDYSTYHNTFSEHIPRHQNVCIFSRRDQVHPQYPARDSNLRARKRTNAVPHKRYTTKTCAIHSGNNLPVYLRQGMARNSC